MHRVPVVAGLLAWTPLLGCGTSPASPAPAVAPDAAPMDAASMDVATISDAPGDVDKAAPCATSFGANLTNAFGRFDGTVLAVVPPDDQACTLPNSTHLVIQLTSAGVAYRMVVDVLSSSGSPDVLFDELDAPLAGPWVEGWHPGVMLDYVTTLGVHSPAFTAMQEASLVATISAEITLGAHLSVFATVDGEPNSAHLVHRNLTNADGAIVVRPDSASPHYLLMRFSEQTF
jgi:hypothetical protein